MFVTYMYLYAVFYLMISEHHPCKYTIFFPTVSGEYVHSKNGSLEFLVIGDWGGLPYFPYRTPIESAVAYRLSLYAAKHNIEFVLALGDNFYFDGVKDIEDPRFQVSYQYISFQNLLKKKISIYLQETYNHVYQYDSLNVDWHFVAGNHDHNGNVSAQIEFSKLMKRWYVYTLPN